LFKRLFEKYPTLLQFAKFAVVGFMNTGVDWGILNLLIFMTHSGEQGLRYTIFKTISFVAAATFSYFFNKFWVFKGFGKQRTQVEFPMFFGVSVVGALVNVTAASLVVNYIPVMFNLTVLWPTVGAAAGSACGLLWNFFGYKYFVFKGKKEGDNQI